MSEKSNLELLKLFLETEPPYKQTVITHDFFNALNTNFTNVKLELNCTNCKDERVFVFKNCFDGGHRVIQYRTLEDNSIKLPLLRYLVEYECSFCGKIYLFPLILENNIIQKIGQSPSFAQLEQLSVEKYRNVLSKYYIEYKRSLSAYSQGMGVASFVYLRRILENLVEHKYAKLENKNNEIKFLDKLKAVEKCEQIIPEEIQKIKGQIYSILSKGIHEYTEEECIRLYDVVRFVIELILDKQLEEKQRNDKIAASVAQINGKLRTENDK